jgi:hypothetical protein
MRKKNSCFIAGMVSIAFIAASSLTALAADVKVYAEGAYTATKLDVYIYADINAAPLVSAGVSLTYDNTKLTLVSALKKVKPTDPEIWYFGTPTAPYVYQEPQDTGSEVVFLCGKLDTDNPGVGVNGSRKLIGKVTFSRTESGAPGVSPEVYFGSTLGLGIIRTEPDVFANFVTNGGTVLDSAVNGVSYAITIRERGDANTDRVITTSDYYAAKSRITSGVYAVYADCNDDGVITTSDYYCIKSLMK